MFKKEKLIDWALVIVFVGLIFLLGNKPQSPVIIEWSNTGDYLTIKLANEITTPLKLSGLKLEFEKKQIVIPDGAPTFISGQVNNLEPIWLALKEKIIINLGWSPVGVSFKENLCSGYLAETQSFIPKFNDACPRQSPPAGCEAEFDSIPKCVSPIKINRDFTPLCLEAVLKLNYNDCLAENFNQKNFFGPWRIYLNLENDFVVDKKKEIKLVLE
ncbi:MAG: hypothetical protein AAB453_04945 [Patescibacteria group bacterium]